MNNMPKFKNEVKVDILLGKTSMADNSESNKPVAPTSTTTGNEQQKSPSSPSSSPSSSSPSSNSTSSSASSSSGHEHSSSSQQPQVPTITTAASATNCHVNQYYYHVNHQQLNSQMMIMQPAPSRATTVAEAANYYLPHQKTDRVVQIINHQNTSFYQAASNSNRLVTGGVGNSVAKKTQQRTQLIEQQNRIKCIEEVVGKKHQKQQPQQTSTEAQSSTEIQPNTIATSKNQQVTPSSSNQISLNHSLSSENGKLLS